MTSSSSLPLRDVPFFFKTPITWSGTFFTRTVWPTGSSSANSSSATVFPRTVTSRAAVTSAAVNSSPSSGSQRRMAK